MKSGFFLFAAALIGMTVSVSAQDIIYFSMKGRGLKNGRDWENAAPQDHMPMLAERAPRSTQFWMEAGIYSYEKLKGNQDDKPWIVKHSLYGGFNGTEQYIVDRQRWDMDQNGVTEPWEFGNVVRIESTSYSDRRTAMLICKASEDSDDPLTLDGLRFSGVAVETEGTVINTIIKKCNDNKVALHLRNGTITGSFITQNQCAYPMVLEHSICKNVIVGNNTDGVAIELTNSQLYNSAIAYNRFKQVDGLILTGSNVINNCLIAGNTAERNMNIEFKAAKNGNDKFMPDETRISNLTWVQNLTRGGVPASGHHVALLINDAMSVNVDKSIFWQSGTPDAFLFEAHENAVFNPSGIATDLKVPKKFNDESFFKLSPERFKFAGPRFMYIPRNFDDFFHNLPYAWMLNDGTPIYGRGYQGIPYPLFVSPQTNKLTYPVAD